MSQSHDERGKEWPFAPDPVNIAQSVSFFESHYSPSQTENKSDKYKLVGLVNVCKFGKQCLQIKQLFCANNGNCHSLDIPFWI